jgi:hypothetical protein
MSDSAEPCGCEEAKRLRLAIREYIENNDDTGIRREYGLETRDAVEKLQRVDEPLSIRDRHQIYEEILRLRAINSGEQAKVKPLKQRVAEALKEACLRCGYAGGAGIYEVLARAAIDAIQEKGK